MNPSVFAHKLASIQRANPWRVLLFSFVATLVTAVIASGLTFDSRYEALLPVGDPEIAKIEEVRNQTGGVRQLVVAIEGKDPQVRLE